MKAIKCVFIMFAVVATAMCCGAKADPRPREKADEKIVVEGNNKFALELYARLRARKGNLFFSPYSISTALAMTYAGAGGETEKQMAEVLHFPTVPRCELNKGPGKSTELAWSREHFHSAFGAVVKDLNARGEKGGYELTVANALWGQKSYSFNEEFLQLTEENYDGRLNEVDFAGDTEAARRAINAWVEKETREKIKNLIQKGVLDSTIRLVLTNAIYFKGNWARQFDEDKTKDELFTLLGGEKVDVPMMNQTAEFGYMEGDGFQGLELGYADEGLSMIVLLPKGVDRLSEFEKTVTVENLSDWLGELRKRKVRVLIPRFKLTRQFGLGGVLKSMGMTSAFCPGEADFSGMTGKRELFISAVIHKAYVDVNEEGTEAAAATAVTMKLTSAEPVQIPVFRADHPFVFFIRDNCSGSILFIGRVMNPKG